MTPTPDNPTPPATSVAPVQAPLNPEELDARIPKEVTDKYGKGTNLSRFHHYLFDLESPDHFITWTFLFMVSSCLGRKVWIGNDFGVYPNLYVIIVGPPAVGKSLPSTKGCEIMRNLIEIKTEGDKVSEKALVKVSPDSVTLEALYDELAGATEAVKISEKNYYSHASMSFCMGDEMGTLFREKTNDLVTFLVQGWDCRDFRRKTRSQGEVNIKNMCINFIGCCTEDWIMENVSSRLINQGFTSRVIFLHSDEPRKTTTLLKVNADQRNSIKLLSQHLRRISKLCGEVKFSPAAFEWFDNWVQTKYRKVINQDKRLQHYYGRKKVHLMKLAMVCHFMDKVTMELDVEDFERAIKILELAEMDMHKAMLSSGRNPIHVLATQVLNGLKRMGQKSFKRLLVEHFEEGNEEEITTAITWLQNTGQVNSSLGEGGVTVYDAVEEGE